MREFEFKITSFHFFAGGIKARAEFYSVVKTSSPRELSCDKATVDLVLEETVCHSSRQSGKTITRRNSGTE